MLEAKRERLQIDMKYNRYDWQLETLLDAYKLNDPESARQKEKLKVFKLVGYNSKRPTGKPFLFVNLTHSQYMKLQGNTKKKMPKAQSTFNVKDPINV